MVKDPRYTTIKKLITTGSLGSFREIFDTLPKTVVALDLGTNNRRINRLLNNPGKFTISDIYRLAELIEVDLVTLAQLVARQYLIDKKKKP